MRVADMRHVVDGVEVAAAVGVVEILQVAADDLERLAIGDAEIAADPLAPRRQNILSRCGAAACVAVEGKTDDEIGIGAEAKPEGTLAGTRHSGKFSALAEQVNDDLEMQVRRPAAVDRSIA